MLGVANGIRALRIFRLARTRRCARVVSGSRNAWAISVSPSPQTARRVSATRASSESAGWQQVKTRRNTSSSRSPGSPGLTVNRFICSSSAGRRRSRRMRSIAQLRAVTASHAGGFGGTPSAGQRRSAIRNASCRASSAASKSCRLRASHANRPVNCSRKICSTCAVVSKLTLRFRGLADHCIISSISRIGRTSIAPWRAPGIRRAQAIAWSRSEQSSTK